MMMAPSEQDELMARRAGFKSAAQAIAWQRGQMAQRGPAIVIPGQSTPAELARQKQQQQAPAGGWLSALARIGEALSR